MQKAEFLARHPHLVALAFATLVGFAGYSTFRAGFQYAMLRGMVGDGARAASEALGG